MNIMFINSLSARNYEMVVSNEGPYLKDTFYNAETFLEEGLGSWFEINTLFIFLNVPWTYLKIKFKNHGIILSGGSHTRRELLSPLEWRLSNYLTFILNVNFDNVVDNYLHYYRENKESIFRSNFKVQYKKVISVIRSSYELSDAMNTVGNIDVDKLFAESIRAVSPKIKWNLIFNNLFKVTLEPGYMSITVKDEQRELVKKIIEILRVKKNPFNLKGKFKHVTSPFTGQFRSYSTSKEVDLYKYTGKKEFFDRMAPYKYEKDLENAQYEMEINWADLMLRYYQDKSHVAKDLTHQTDTLLSKVIEKINIIKDDLRQDIIRKKYTKLYPFLNYEGAALVALVISRECIIRGEGYTNTCAGIGITIVKDAYMRLYQKYSKTENFVIRMNDPSSYLYSFENFVKFLGLVNYDYASIGTFFLSFYMNGDTQIFDTYFGSSGDKDDPNFRYMLKYTDEYLNKLEEEFKIRPMLMPMLCKPALWSKNKFGGYLSNSIMKEGFTIGTKVHAHKFSNEDIIYETLNNLNKIPFQVNNLLLTYLKGVGKYLLSKSNIDLEPYVVERILGTAEFFSDVDKF
nr:hypothetical protein [Ganoderma lingzhi]UOL49800.1 hypothetical protein [Ganoderma lingzhi]UOL49912.1 hypothetical protein [Ganoderma lingzhi]UOL50133.1 hypothetical protein [Ganoderma lingzhi]